MMLTYKVFLFFHEITLCLEILPKWMEEEILMKVSFWGQFQQELDFFLIRPLNLGQVQLLTWYSVAFQSIYSKTNDESF